MKMPPYRKPTVEEVLRKYGAKIESQIKTSASSSGNYSNEYIKFKDEIAPELSKYERWCQSLGSIIKVKVNEKDDASLKKHLEAAHLDVEPWQALTLALMAFIGVFLFGLFSSIAIMLVFPNPDGVIASFPVLYFILIMIVSLFLYYFTRAYPERFANKWRLKASSQMVPAILYVVVYMRHTPNLEKAIAFAAEHLEEPLSLDFKKVFYNVEVGKFSTIKESLDHYLETWRGYSTEFIEAFHLIEGSLFEPDNSRRIVSLEKSLQVVLDGVYDKMLKFTHSVRSPLTNVYMLGVVLPTLGLALLPLASAMLGRYFKWYYIFILFNLIVPFFVFFLTDKVMFLRPGGHGEASLIQKSPLYADYKNSGHFYSAFIVVLPFIILGLLPLIFHFTPLPSMIGLKPDYTFEELGLPFLKGESVFGFTPEGAGPFGIGALLLGMFFPLGIAMFFSLAYGSKTRDMIVERENTKELEDEFNNSLFALGNRIGNGVPPELAFGKVAEGSNGLKTEDFFRRVNYNVKQMGMSVEKAIFDKRRGAIVYYPSGLISISMRILVEASKKGLKIAAISLMSISEYVKNMYKITQRLKDMLAEVISDMKSNITFLAPLLAGIVVGLAAMITTILSKIDLATAIGSSAETALGNLGDLVGPNDIFAFKEMVPPYYLQIVVGIYLIQIIFILTRTIVTVDAGEDQLSRINETGKNLSRGLILYFITAFFATMGLFILSSVVLGGLF